MNLLIKILSKIRKLLDHLIRKLSVLNDKQYTLLLQWYKDDPHSLKKTTFLGLNEESVIFDLGGYEGQWSSDIFSRFRSHIFIFEPVLEYVNIMTDRFIQNDKIQIFYFGLGDKNLETEITIDQFASSTYDYKNNKKLKKEKIIIKDFNLFIRETNISHIDLIKINIEGGEYDLLEHLITTGKINILNKILVQFHSFVPNADVRLSQIKAKLSITHKPKFEYIFIWEYWEKRI